ncbi:MAG: S9 family peptidase, partial [Pseudomonadota bacterium]
KNRPVVPRRFLQRQDHLPQFQDRIVDILPDEENALLLALSLESSEGSAVVKVDIADSSARRVEPNRQYVVNWVTDRQSRVRLRVWRRDTEYRIIHREPGGKRWTTLWEFEAFADDQVWPLGFDEDPNRLFVQAYHDGRLAIFAVDLTDADLGRELVFADPRYDVDGSLIYSTVKRAVIGTTYSRQGGFTFWDDEYKGLQNGIDKVMPDTRNVLYGFSADERRYIVLATGDTEPGMYLIGDRDARSLDLLAYRYRGLPSAKMAAKQRIEYEARDGLAIEGFLTLPQDSDGKELPAIVFPHGGPISFDGGGFDYWTQYFASRGFAVLQMNFRGSAGYGYDFLKAGLANWGLEMQNDVEDGTRWLIGEGIADPDRICIVGASYGGYAALMEATRNGGLYRCAVSFAGVTDVAYLVKSQRRYTISEIVEQQVGSNLRDLRRRSPLHLSEQIDVPVLLAHGTEDRSVQFAHGERMHRALDKGGKTVTFLELDGGDHYLSNQTHRLEFFAAMDSFLGEHLHPD